MCDRTFEDAYLRVRAKHSDQRWFSLSPREITSAIYEEIHILDSERLGSPTSRSSDGFAIAAE